MEKYSSTTKFYIPDQKPIEEAIKRTTHMGIVAHHDDLEIAAYDGILSCYKQKDKWFTGVVMTDGRGSARGGLYKNYTDEEMIKVRIIEQEKAAVIGEYGAQIFLNKSSKDTKNPNAIDIVDELSKLLKDCRPEVLYTHNLADKHDTHIGVVTKVIKALRALPKEIRPKKFYGCEVWRDLDWLQDSEKVRFSVGGNPNLADQLIKVFDSQIDGAKQYDKATLGRRFANATFGNPYKEDDSDSVIIGMDLTPLIEDDSMDVADFISDAIDRFKSDVREKIKRIY